tara:strand:+ start:1004 stop:2050 length:1047 start_codon:yes stop_codon:yes gene_type:complete
MFSQQRFIKDFEEQEMCPEVYQPSLFWRDALIKIEESLKLNGLDGFRGNKTNLKFFVPTYGYPSKKLSAASISETFMKIGKPLNHKQMRFIENKFNGYDHALSDYRAFKIANDGRDYFGLLNFSESKIGNPIEHFRFENRWFSRSSLNYLLGLSLLCSIAPDFKPKKILEIGGGFGTLAEIIAKSNLEGSKYLGLDLPVMTSIAKNYFSNCFNGQKSKSITTQILKETFTFDDLLQYSFLPNWKIEALEGSIDLFVNFISFQEMEPDIVSNYIFHVQRLKPQWVLLRNLREGKQLALGKKVGVYNKLLTKDYLEYFYDYELVKSSVLEYGFETPDGFNSELLVLKKRN